MARALVGGVTCPQAGAGPNSQTAEYRTRVTTDSVELRLKTVDDFDAAMAIALSLPEWFNDLGIEQITEALPGQPGGVAEVDGDVVGWVTWTSEGDLGEIAWIAVSPDHHRHGIGARLIEFAEDRLRVSGVTDVHGRQPGYERGLRAAARHESVITRNGDITRGEI